LRFAPFTISNEQLASVHGVDENLDVITLPDAVDFYKKIIERI
jgi:acetylornithine deacetylase/succinyl-diaminopimelate desuccinylase-like protein